MKNTLLLKKSDVIEAFGTVKAVVAALHYRNAHSVYKWPETLPLETSDRVRGAWMRLNPAGVPAPRRRRRRRSWLVRGRAA